MTDGNSMPGELLARRGEAMDSGEARSRENAACGPFRQLVLDVHYGEASRQDSLSLEEHLRGCADCREHRAGWERLAGWLSAPDVAAELAPPSGSADWMLTGFPSRTPVALLLAVATAAVSLAFILGSGSAISSGPGWLFLATLLWTLAYQALFEGGLLEWRRRGLPGPVDVRNVAYGLFASQLSTVLIAATLVGLPLMAEPLSGLVRLSLPDLLTALSGSVLLAVCAVVSLRGRGGSAWRDAAAICTLHGVLLASVLLLLHPQAATLGRLAGRLVFVVICGATGTLLGAAAAATEGMRVVAQAGLGPRAA